MRAPGHSPSHPHARTPCVRDRPTALRCSPPKGKYWCPEQCAYIELAEGQEPPPPKRAKNQDPNKPKRAMSSFLYFAQLHRQRLKQRNPTITFRESQLELSKLWKEADEAARRPFEEMAERERERYRAQMARYVPPPPGFVFPKAAVQRKKTPRDPMKPKRAMSSYLLFCDDVREELRKQNPKAKMAVIQKLAAEQWKTLSDAQKEPYLAKQRELREVWAEQKEQYDDHVKKNPPPHQEATLSAEAIAETFQHHQHLMTSQYQLHTQLETAKSMGLNIAAIFEGVPQPPSDSAVQYNTAQQYLLQMQGQLQAAIDEAKGE